MDYLTTGSVSVTGHQHGGIDGQMDRNTVVCYAVVQENINNNILTLYLASMP